jgi:O-antigen/teichoic acid export membrane protein
VRAKADARGAPSPHELPLTPSTRYFASYVWNTVARFADFGIAYIFTVIVARILAPAEYGTFTTVMSVATLAFVVTSTGIDNTLHKFIGEASASSTTFGEIPSLLRSLLTVRVLLTIAVASVVFASRHWIAGVFEADAVAGLIGIATLYIVAQSLASFGANALTGMLRTGVVAALTTVARVLNIAVVGVVLRWGSGVSGVLFLLGFTSALAALAYLRWILPLVRRRGTPVDTGPVFSFAASAWVLSVVGFGLGRQSDVILLSALRHVQEEVAIYDVAYSLAQTVAMGLTIGLAGIALTLFAKRFRARPDELGSLWGSFVVLVGAAVVPFLAFVAVHARAAVVGIYGAPYREAGVLLQVFTAASLPSWILGGGAGTTVLQATARIGTAVRIRVVFGLANVVANVFLIRAWGPAGAILGTGVCASGAVVAETVAARRLIGARLPTRHLPGMILATAVALLPSVLLRPVGLPALVGHALLFTAIYLAALATVRPFPALDEGLVGSLPKPARDLLRRLSR